MLLDNPTIRLQVFFPFLNKSFRLAVTEPVIAGFDKLYKQGFENRGQCVNQRAQVFKGIDLRRGQTRRRGCLARHQIRSAKS
ncbi:hypothetical protein D3C76_327350 [compost metagenome]